MLTAAILVTLALPRAPHSDKRSEVSSARLTATHSDGSRVLETSLRLLDADVLALEALTPQQQEKGLTLAKETAEKRLAAAQGALNTHAEGVKNARATAQESFWA